jgi:M6 family metalloprotease-like protein
MVAAIYDIIIMRCKLLLASLFYLIPCISLHAVSAYPHKIAVPDGDSVLYIRLFGDEYSKHAETIDGYTLIQNNSQWYYAEKDDKGDLIASPYKLSSKKSLGLIQFLERMPKHIKAEHGQALIRSKISGYSTRANGAAVGERKILIILMQFTDVQFVKSKDDFDHLFNGIGYSEDGAFGSVLDYYTDVSYGQLQLSCDIIGPFTSKYNRNYYGKNDKQGNDANPTALFEEAMEYAVQEVRLNQYDADDDGYVDNVHIVFAGHGEEAGAASGAIWSHEASFGRGFSYQDMLIDRYSCAPELRGNTGTGISRIGPHCHEIGHALGAMDYYDTNYESNGLFEGTGCWDIMASGSWNEDGVVPADFNPYVKAIDFGWIEPIELPEGHVDIYPSLNSDNNYFRLTNSTNDYYLLENRTTDKWGSGLPGGGLLIFHVHPNVASSGNDINSTFPQKCYPVCASSTFPQPTSSPNSYGSINSEGCPYPGISGNRSFTSTSIPKAFAWDGSTCNVNISNIQIESDGRVSLFNQSSTSDKAIGSILFQDGFETSKTYEIVSGSGISDWTQYFFSIYTHQKGELTPHTGNGCLRLRPNKTTEEEQESTLILHSLESEEACESVFSFYFSGKSFRPEEDILYITYNYDETENSDTVYVRSNLSGWNNYIQELPPAKKYKINITGKASYGQIIYLDDIEIVQKKSSSIDQRPKTNMDSGIYDLLGRKLTRRSKGLNIVKDSDGTIKKIFVR